MLLSESQGHSQHIYLLNILNEMQFLCWSLGAESTWIEVINMLFSNISYLVYHLSSS